MRSCGERPVSLAATFPFSQEFISRRIADGKKEPSMAVRGDARRLSTVILLPPDSAARGELVSVLAAGN